MIKPISVARQNTPSQGREASFGKKSSNPTFGTKPAQHVRLAQNFQHVGDSSREQFQSAASRDNATDFASSNSNSEAGSTVAKLTQALQTRFVSVATNQDQFHALLKQTLGDNYDVAAAETIGQQALNNDFSWMPNIEVVDGQTLNDSSGTQADGVGLGAYNAQTNTIYLNEQLLEGHFDDALNVLTEETGHALDARLNTTDAIGDEGAAFARLLSGKNVDAAQLNKLRAEHDTGSIIVDGKEVEVEYSWLSKQIRRTGRQIDQNIIQPVKKETKRFGKKVDENVLQPAKDAGKLFWRGALALSSVLLIRPYEEGWAAIAGYAGAMKHLFNGEFSEAWDAVKDTSLDALTSIVRLPLEAGAISLHTIAGVYDTLRGDLDERKLNSEEIQYLQGIYGDSVNYGDIKIQTGGVKDQLGMRANVWNYLAMK